MKMIDISLPDPMKVWVETQAEQGSYSDTSDYVQHLIRREQNRQHALDRLRTAVTYDGTRLKWLLSSNPACWASENGTRSTSWVALSIMLMLATLKVEPVPELKAMAAK